MMFIFPEHHIFRAYSIHHGKPHHRWEANMTPALARIRRFGINGPPLDAESWKLGEVFLWGPKIIMDSWIPPPPQKKNKTNNKNYLGIISDVGTQGNPLFIPICFPLQSSEIESGSWRWWFPRKHSPFPKGTFSGSMIKLRGSTHILLEDVSRKHSSSEMIFFWLWFGDGWGKLANHLDNLDFGAHGRAVILVDCRLRLPLILNRRAVYFKNRRNSKRLVKCMTLYKV